MLESTGSSSTISTSMAGNTIGPENKISPSTVTSSLENVVVSPVGDFTVTVTTATLLLGFRYTDVTCGADSTPGRLRSKVTVGFSAVSSPGKVTINGEDVPAYFCNTTEELSVVTLTCSRSEEHTSELQSRGLISY